MRKYKADWTGQTKWKRRTSCQYTRWREGLTKTAGRKTTCHDCTLLSSTSRNGWPQCQTTRWREGLMKRARQKTWKPLVMTAPNCHHPPWMAGHSVTYLILFPLLYLLLEVGLAQVNLRLHVLQQVKQVLPQWEASCGSFGTGDGQRQENEVLHSHKMSERLHNYTQTCIVLNTDLFTLKYW